MMSIYKFAQIILSNKLILTRHPFYHHIILYVDYFIYNLYNISQNIILIDQQTKIALVNKLNNERHEKLYEISYNK